MGSRPRLTVLSFVLLVVYVGSYLWISRKQYARADQYGLSGFNYVMPERTEHWHIRNGACLVVFGPLNVLDRILGCGRSPGMGEPLWELRK